MTLLRPVRRRCSARTVAAVSCLAVLAGSNSLSAASDTSSGSADGETVTIGMAEAPNTLDPAIYSVVAAQTTWSAIGYLVYEPYVPFPDQSLYDGEVPVLNADEYLPGLVESWEVSEDGTQVHMTLREGVMSQYGNEFTAEDVKWTYERDFAMNAWAVTGLQAARIDPDEPITINGPHELTWNLSGPSPFFMKTMAWSALGPIDSTEAKKHATADDPWAADWLANNMAFYGPYRMTSFIPGQELILEADPNFWGEAPDIETLVFRSVPDAGNRQQLLQRGDIQYVPDIPRNQLLALNQQEQPNVNVVYGPGTRFSYLQFDPHVEPWDDVLVRRAVALATPRERIVTDVYGDQALLAPGPGVWLPHSDGSLAFPYEQDLEQAQSLLAEAGYPDGFEVTLSYSVANPGPENEQAAILIADELAKIGITVNLDRPSSEAEFQANYFQGVYKFSLNGAAAGIPDTGYQMWNLGGSTGSQNHEFFFDPEYEEHITTLLTTTDEEVRAEAIREAQRIYGEQVPSIPLVNPLLGLAMSPTITTVRLNAWGFAYWPDMAME